MSQRPTGRAVHLRVGQVIGAVSGGGLLCWQLIIWMWRVPVCAIGRTLNIIVESFPLSLCIVNVAPPLMRLSVDITNRVSFAANVHDHVTLNSIFLNFQ